MFYIWKFVPHDEMRGIGPLPREEYSLQGMFLSRFQTKCVHKYFLTRVNTHKEYSLREKILWGFKPILVISLRGFSFCEEYTRNDRGIYTIPLVSQWGVASVNINGLLWSELAVDV